MQAQLRELNTIECKFAVGGIDVEDTHHAIAAHDRLDGVVGTGSRLAKIFLGGLRFWQLERARRRQGDHTQRRGDEQRDNKPAPVTLRFSADLPRGRRGRMREWNNACCMLKPPE